MTSVLIWAVIMFAAGAFVAVYVESRRKGDPRWVSIAIGVAFVWFLPFIVGRVYVEALIKAPPSMEDEG